MEVPAGSSPLSLQLFVGNFQFRPGGKRGRNRGQNTPPLPQSGRVWAALARGWGRSCPGRWRTQCGGVGSWARVERGSGRGHSQVIPPAECEKRYYEQVEVAVVAD